MGNRNETYISNGPFNITEWVPGSHIIMSKNPYYWNADAIKLGSIKFVLMEDSNAAYTAFQSGDVLFIRVYLPRRSPAYRVTLSSM